ncbi:MULTISPECIES: hydrogenase maturation protease [Nguyenibacter]|uniref:Hydrogenase maturation protease n=1 Tax=Nguyenibacter vanlangensis TaxID=1216886 RepID=A0A7Y7M3S9_9PROT|nr:MULTISPECIES: hydrogenase maturation protease [Nguyenibacter]NVN10015.1 hydrogenase maturation protease [Nguyenibacter vanlangensis]WRH88976.1 hydrogenase maturation protease [Nguyenibacter sp. L1]
MIARTLVIGVGNPGREDDGLGPAAATAIAGLRLPNIAIHDPYQLAIEDALDIAENDVVWFIDATLRGHAPFRVTPVFPAPEIGFTSHVLSPPAVLAIARDYLGATPRAYQLAIRGYSFTLAEDLTPRAARNLGHAVRALGARLRGDAG